jgi:hypothetical protein
MEKFDIHFLQQQPPRPLRHPSGPPFPNYQGDRLSASSLSTPPPSMLGTSPRQSPTPASIGAISGNDSVTPTSDQASNFGIYNEGGTTYFISGNEMVTSAKKKHKLPKILNAHLKQVNLYL